MTTCSTCRFWIATTCRRNAPIAIPVLIPKIDTMAMSGLTLQTVWPSTRDEDLCGQHESRKEGP